MLAFCTVKIKELEGADLCGFIFKKDSPSSGLFRVKVYNNGAVAKSSSGLFAAAVARHFPLLPMEEEGRLNDPYIRENFIERVFSYRRWRDFLAAGPTLGLLVTFHTAHKLLMMGYFKKQLSPEERVELMEAISQYHEGFTPLLGPLTLLKHYVRKYNLPYLQYQLYLTPHPAQLMLRNHV